MDLQDILKIAVVICFTCFIHSGYTLRCYECITDSPYSNVTCKGTVKNCSQQDTYCNIYTIKGSNSEFTRDCVPAKVCAKGWCRTMEDMLSKSNCTVRCCNTDLCNAYTFNDTISNPSSSSQRLIPFRHAVSLMTVYVYLMFT